MTYQIPTDAKTFLSELNKIRRNIHPQFKGDGVYNADAIIVKLRMESPSIAKALSEQILSIETEFHPSRVKQISRALWS